MINVLNPKLAALIVVSFVVWELCDSHGGHGHGGHGGHGGHNHDHSKDVDKPATFEVSFKWQV